MIKLFCGDYLAQLYGQKEKCPEGARAGHSRHIYMREARREIQKERGGLD